jgi:hypothetical protein
MALLLVHLTATAALAGLVWVVQLVVYPSFLLVGAADRTGAAFAAVHAAHTRAVTWAVGPPWAVQGASLAALLVRDGLSPLRVLTGLLALATVVVTVTVQVPLHARLDRGWGRAGRAPAGVDELAADGGVDGRRCLRRAAGGRGAVLRAGP